MVCQHFPLSVTMQHSSKIKPHMSQYLGNQSVSKDGVIYASCNMHDPAKCTIPVPVRASTVSPSDAPRNGLVFTPALGPVGGMTLYRDGRMVAGWALSLRKTFL